MRTTEGRNRREAGWHPRVGRLFLKFTAFSVLLLAVSLSGLTAVLLLDQRAAYEQEMRNRWLRECQTAALGLENAVQTNAFEDLPELLDRLHAAPDVVECSVIAAKDMQVYFSSSTPDFVGEPASDELVSRCILTGEVLFEIFPGDSGQPGIAKAVIPLYVGDEIWGAGRFYYSTENLKELTRSLYSRLVILAVLFLAIGVLGALFLSHHIAAPVEKLAVAADRVARGDLDVTCDVRRKDEVGDLALSFDRMVANLKVARRGARIYLDNILESMADSLIVLEPERNGQAPRIRTVNRATLDLLGCLEEDLVGKPIDSVFGEGKARESLLRAFRRKGEIRNQDTFYRTKRGVNTPVRFSASAMRGGSGLGGADAHQGYVLVASDVQELAQAEQERARLSSAVEQAGDAILIGDSKWRIQYVNPAFERISGFSSAEAIGRAPRFLRSGHEDRLLYREIWSKLGIGQTWKGRTVMRRKDGSECEVDATLSPVLDAEGRTVNFVCVQHDVTQEVALEEQLRHSQKMEAIGKLAGGIAHDFNNILSVIGGCSDLLLAKLSEEDPARSRVTEIQRAGKRAAALTRQLLAFSRRQVLMPRVLCLNEVVADVEKMLRRLIGEDISLETDIEPDLGTVRADPHQIEQVLMNLAVNARDAMPDGGSLSIRTRNVTLDESFRNENPEVPTGEYALVCVADTGCGMEEEVRERAFEPFFTTREPGKGTGLGLATVYGIVKQSGGHVTVESALDRGTRFRIYLPCVVGEMLAPDTGPVDEEDLQGSGTILLVEDEEGVREVTREFLEIYGYRVIEAVDGEQALDLMAERDEPIDLLVTDVVMPKLGGRELAANLSVRFPDLRVLFISGYSGVAFAKQEGLRHAAAYLAKPFSSDALARMVRALLRGDELVESSTAH